MFTHVPAGWRPRGQLECPYNLASGFSGLRDPEANMEETECFHHLLSAAASSFPFTCIC